MSIIYAGDLHGRLKHFKALDTMARQMGITTIVQVGDFGVGFVPDCDVVEWFKNRDIYGPTWITCGGNHDNWPLWRQRPAVPLQGLVSGYTNEIAPGCFFAERNSVIEIGGVRHLFFGGAESIDRHRRTPGLDWWPEETPTYGDFTGFMAALEEHGPEVVVTHEAPLSVPLKKIARKASPTPKNLENVVKLSEHLPKRWYFGHHHITGRWNIGDTDFICTGVHGGFAT
tara:strand:- start:11031 stop:11714 length:684 start_codon:yes stop_codon:yes gene_type:complete